MMKWSMGAAIIAALLQWAPMGRTQNLILVASNSAWRYLDNGTDQGTAWRAPGFNDSGWASGAAQLGFGDGDEVTLLSRTNASGATNITFYFRRAFTVTNASAFTSLGLWLLRDDGGVVYLNGTEIFRSPNMPAGPIAFNTLTVGTAPPDNTVDQAAVSPSLLVAGTNVIAVEIHQQSLSSSDVSFDFELTGTRNTPPAVSITNPTNNARFVAPADVAIDVTASDADGIAKVEFFQGTTKLGEDLGSPYGLIWPAAGAGSYQLRAVATDTLGLSATSAVVNITVTNNARPVVSLTNPTNNASFQSPANILLAATASDADGIAKVEFFSGTNKLGEDASAPYSITWSNAPAGSYALTAVATDGAGFTGTSAPANITVSGSVAGTNFLITFGATWKYLDNGSDQGTAWRAINFDDSSWASGPAQLGYGDGDEATVVSYGPDPNNKYITTYFRRAFTVANAASYNFLNLRLLYDDGGAVYLNGTEIYRTPTLPAGPIDYLTRASLANDNTIGVATGLSNLLVEGTNVVAVEIHQESATSSDVSFDFDLAAVVANVPPVVFIASPTNNTTVTAPTNVTITASASDPDGSVALVEFFLNGSKLGEDAVAPYSVVWSNVTVGGTYQLRAAATDNLGAKATSAVVNVTVLGNLLPTVTLTNPPNFITVYLPTNGTGTNLLLGASASDPDGTVSKVEFYAGATKLGQDTTSPYTFNWTNSTPGTFLLSAVATDNSGGTATSPPVTVSFALALDAPPILVATGAVWSYLDDGTDQGTAWRTLAFDDTGWASGPAQLGFGENDEATVVRKFDPANPTRQIITYYFRNKFVVNNPTAYHSLSLQLKRDDGAVVYLNGAEIVRDLFPAGANILYNTLSANATDDGQNWWPFNINPALLTAGTNLLAVEVHQSTATSTDISFDLGLSGVTSNMWPAVTLTSPTDGTVFNAPAIIPLAASASDSDGSISSVTFYANGTNTLATLTLAPYTYSWEGMPLGAYALTAVALDNEGARATSRVATVFVMTSSAPTVDSFVPAAGVISNLTQIQVNFSEPVDGVNASDLLVNGTSATGVTGSNSVYTFTFPQPAEGLIVVTWASGHGIMDRENPPKPFNGAGPGETVQYTLVDVASPTVVALAPTPGATVRAFSSIAVNFSEPVGGVTDQSLRINGQPANRVSGSLAGPYVFEFTQPANGLVQMAWATNHGIHDLAASRNPFAGVSWIYTLNPLLVETNIVINEIMFHPSSERTDEEYVELYNRGATPVNLTGWKLNRGVDFTFPAVTLPAGGYLVIASSTNAFAAKYPGVANVVGNWRGTLRNSDDQVELEDASGTQVDLVSYADEGDWAIRVRSALYPQGWDWLCQADGLGSSFELINPAMPNDTGQNWASSATAQGTPGRANSVAAPGLAPLILDVAHDPAVPRSTNTVTVTARVLDEQAGVSVSLFYRDASSASPPAFTSVPMFDDGAHGDGIAGDGVYGAILPAQADRAVVEFYVQAQDVGALTRTWPAAARQADNVTFAQTCNALYGVTDESPAGNQPVFRLVMTQSERDILAAVSRNSDAQMNATFITVDGVETRVRYNVGVRYRGAGTRYANPPNYRVLIPNDRLWNGVDALNLNSQYTHSQLAGFALASESGLHTEWHRAVKIRVNGDDIAGAGSPQYGSYMHQESRDAVFAERHFPNNPGGNIYAGITGSHSATLAYLGTNPSSYINAGYLKQSNGSENDWTDLINLTYVLNNTPDYNYTAAVRQVVDVNEWMLYFAVFTMTCSMETSLGTGYGDDFAMYRGLQDTRFQLLGHDWDTILNEGDTAGSASTDLFRATRVASINRFLKWPDFVPLYYAQLKRLSDTAFAPAQLNPLLDQMLASWVPQNVVDRMKTFAAARRSYVLSQIPLSLTLNHSLAAQNGYPYTTTPSVTLWGQANAIDTRKVLVNGAPSVWSAWEARWTNNVSLQPGLNTVLVQALNTNSVEFERATLVIWYDDGSVQNVSGAIATDTAWTAAGGPYNVTANLTVNPGVSLTILPGTTVYLGAGVGLTVANGGRLLAEGTDVAPIRFTRAPGTAGNWGNLVINGSVGSPESRLSYAQFEFNTSNTGTPCLQVSAGTVFFDHLTFGNTAAPYIHVDGASFIIQNCVFPAPTASFEPVHGVSGIKSGGRGIFLRNFFGPITGYNDVIDFTGGNRPGPIVQFIDNVFMGSGDDLLDLDSTDAWIEGNIFLHAHKNGSPDTSSGVSGGQEPGFSDTSQVTLIGNVFYDCDHAAMAKEGNFFTLINNTIVRQTHVGGLDSTGAVVCLADAGTAQAAGMYLEGNIVYDIEQLTQNVTTALVTFTNNLLPVAWTGAGGGNTLGAPLFQHVPQLSETTTFTSWAEAQVLKDWLSLRTGSPAAGTGPNGRDKGGVVPLGVSVAGEPASPTRQTNATLTVGVVRTGSGIPTSGWPNGSGYTHYRWRLDGGAWSAETLTANPISLTGLAPGLHRVAVVGRRDAGLYQDDPAYGADAVLTISRSWVVDPGASPVRLNEILASNQSAVPVAGKFPDLIELYNPGATPVDLTGMGLTDNKDEPYKFTFPPGAVVNPGSYLVVYADNDNTPPGLHTGWTLKQEGDDVYLFGTAGQLIDSLAFGPQLTDLSIGRLADGTWGLTQPTFGAANVAAPIGSPRTLKINEWLAAGVTPVADDFVELFNPDPLPVALGGLFLTDNPVGAPGLHRIAPLSFVRGGGFAVFIADGNPGNGPDHLSFGLAAEQGMIGLFDADLSLIDWVIYGPQTLNVSQGRSPNGTVNLVAFAAATPGAPNPAPPAPDGVQLVINEVLAKNINGLTNLDGSTPEWIELYNATASPISLTDLSLSDSLLSPRKYVFPAGLNLAPGRHYLLFCDGQAPASTTNTGFGIKANGDGVYLFDKLANGGSLLDSIAYGVQANDYSIGRVPSGSSNWVLTLPTPASLNIAASLGDAGQLKVNEWMANPAVGEDWFELYNPNPQPVNISGFGLTDDLSSPASRLKFQVAPLSFLGTRLYGYERFIADSQPANGPDHVTFKLSAGGESLGVSWPDGTLIHGLTFLAQALDVSEGRLPDGSTNIVRFPNSPTPAEANYLPLTNIVVREVLSATPLGGPLEDAIELQNVSGAPVNLKNWYLSDALHTLKKFQFTNNVIVPAGGFVVIYEYQFNPIVGDPRSFGLDGVHGDQVYLSAAGANGALTGYRAAVEFGAAEPGVSFGRYTNSVGQVEFVAMSQRTFGVDNPDTLQEFRGGQGLPNAYPKVGPIVINEIMFHPPDLVGGADNVRDEFIELYNPSPTNAVPLYDPAHPTNTWRLRGGVDLDFPPGIVVPPQGYVVAVSFDPVNDPTALAGFKTTYGALSDVILVGPYQGKLDNGGEDIALQKPGTPVPAGQPDAGYVPHVLVEHVRYDDALPWVAAIAADGTGQSMHRRDPQEYANDPANWQGDSPSPGPVASPLDTDRDGMPDLWELSNGLDPRNPADAGQDPDHDGATNLQEYLAGTDPHNAQSVLRLEIVAGSSVRLQFVAQADKTYAIEYRDGVDSGPWTRLLNVPAGAARTVQVPDAPAGQTRFYRLRTPSD